MTYEVALTPTAEADLRRLDSSVARRAIDKMQWLANNIETIKLETLTGSWQGVFKLRVGAYRVLYNILNRVHEPEIRLSNRQLRVLLYRIESFVTFIVQTWMESR